MRDMGARRLAVTTAIAFIAAMLTMSASPAAASAPAVVATISAGDGPAGIAISPDGAKIYSANQNADTLAVMDTALETRTTTLVGFSQPYAVALNPAASRLYVTNFLSSTLAVINTSTNSITATIDLGSVHGAAVAVHPTAPYAYVGGQGDNKLLVIDTSSNAITDSITLSSRKVEGLALSPSGGVAYATLPDSNTVSVIDTLSKLETATIAVGTSPLGIAITPDGARVYVCNQIGKTISVISTATNAITNTIALANEPYNAAVSPDGSRVYVSSGGGGLDALLVIDTTSNAVIETVTVGSQPWGVVVSPDGRYLYVNNFVSGTVSKLATRPSISTVSPSAGPTSGGTSVTITGSLLESTTAVKFGSDTATFVVNGSSSVTATAPAHTAGTVDLVITGPGWTDTKTAAYRYAPAPSITSLSRTSGPASGGTTTTIKGTNFDSATAVSFGTVPAASFTVDSATQITAITATSTAGAAVSVSVTTAGGTASKAAAFTYTGPIAYAGSLLLNDPLSFCPTSLGFSPDSRWAYLASCVQPSVVTVIDASNDTPTVSETITGFTAGARIGVSPDGSRVYTRSSSSNALWTISVDGNTRTLIDTQTGTGIADFAVSSQGRTMYAVVATNPSILKQFDLATGTPGTATTIATLSIGDANTITIDRSGASVAVTHRSLGIISFVDLTKSPAAMETVTVGGLPQFIAFTPDSSRAFVTNYGDGTVSVLHVEDGRISSVDTITGLPGAWAVAASPDGKWIYVGSRERNVIWKINAATEAVADALAVDWDGNAAEIFTSVTFTPDGNYLYATHQDHSKVYVFRNPPSVSTASPATGTAAGGTSVKITGFGLTGATAVTFGGVAASSFTVDSATQITAVAPAGTAGAVNIVVTSPGGTDTKTAAFTYVAPTPPPSSAPATSSGPVATLTSITPASGPTTGGTEVTISGVFLGNVNGVTFNGIPATSFTIVDSTRIVAVAPPGTAGLVTIVIASPGSTATYGGAFTYVASPAPVPPSTQPTTETPATTPSTPTTVTTRTGTAAAMFTGKSSAVSAAYRKTIERFVTKFGTDGLYKITGFKATGKSATALARARTRAVQRTLIQLGVMYSHITTTFTGTSATKVQLSAKA